MMETRLYNISDYKNLKQWWVGHWGDAPSVYALPQSGLVVEGKERDLAAGWLYLDTTTPTALISWIVAHPTNTPKQTMESLNFLVGGLVEMAKSQGRVNILAACPSGSLSRLLQSCGFQLQDQSIEHLTMIID